MNNQDLIKLNSITVANDDIEIIANEINNHKAENFDTAAFSRLITYRYFNGNKQMADAVLFRLSAFATLSRNNDLAAWTLDSEDNSVSINSAIFSAAACEPLVMINDQLSFDKESFLKKALELAKPKGRVQ